MIAQGTLHILWDLACANRSLQLIQVHLFQLGRFLKRLDEVCDIGLVMPAQHDTKICCKCRCAITY